MTYHLKLGVLCYHGIKVNRFCIDMFEIVKKGMLLSNDKRYIWWLETEKRIKHNIQK